MISTESLLQKQVFTDKGLLVGIVYDVIIDFDDGSVHGLLIRETNETIVEGGKPISIPYGWIRVVGDAILLLTFPQRVTFSHNRSY
jgi:Uncharacterized conserved protein